MRYSLPIIFCSALCSFLLVNCSAASAKSYGAQQTTINGRTNPLGIAADEISFSWAIAAPQRGMTQKAYQIQVSTVKGGRDTWDSGRTVSNRQIDIVLPSKIRLTSATRYYWQVKIWDETGKESDWSTPSWFETGLLSASDWSGAQWIARPAKQLDRAQWTDYTASTEFSLERDALGVLLRATADAQNGYMYQISVTGDHPMLKPHKKVNGGYEVLAPVDLWQFGFTNAGLLQGKHTLVLNVRGSTITAILDGKQVESRSDTTFREGVIGFRTFGSESATVYGVKVTDPNGRILMSPDFSKGESGFSGGVVSDGAYEISGGIEAVFNGDEPSLPLLRRSFQARSAIKSARLYASAHGLYELSLNGKKVGDQLLAPGWTDYNQRIQSQTYDVTALVKPGSNALGVALADGWYRGKVGLGWNHIYGDRLALIARLKLTYTDGSTEWVGTGREWRTANGPFVRADLQDGESYDARREQLGWNTSGFDAAKWRAAEVLSSNAVKLVPQPDEPVRAIEMLTAKTSTVPTLGTLIYDLGQNMVGVARIRLTGKKGQTVRIRYAEELYRKGERRGRLYTDNLRSAQAIDTYTFRENGTITYQPTFTQHGFRYIEITGLDVPPPPEDVKGVVLGSNLSDIGDLQTANPLLNQLVRNIRWGQRGNFLSIPTDTPARDERLGWTGDINVFAPTASRYQDTRAFLSKWMDDVRDSQRPDGSIPAVVPQPRDAFGETGVGWSDAFITVPYAVWRATGDERILRRNWQAMQRFYRFVHESATKDGNLLEEGRSSWFSGDWLTLEQVNRLEEHKVIATAYFAEDTRMMAEMAAVLGEHDNATEWSALVPQIREAFVTVYRSPDGSIYTGTQTVYALALGMNMIADATQRKLTAAKFVEKLAADNDHLKTGFLGTPWLLPALTNIGRDDLAMRLLLNEDYPSWGFEIKMGATTVWERWNTIRADGEFGPVDMNSFNHYAYGAVADWMFQHLGGLQIIEPGYKRSRIAPLFGDLSHGRSSLKTPYGLLASDWKVADGKLTLTATIPANTSAEVVIPAPNAAAVRIGDKPATSVAGVKKSTLKEGKLLLLVGSGIYEFISPVE